MKESNASRENSPKSADLCQELTEGRGWVHQGGTCVLIGDDQAAISEAEQLALKYIGCTIARPSKYYRSKGHHQASFNSLPLHVCPPILPS